MAQRYHGKTGAAWAKEYQAYLDGMVKGMDAKPPAKAQGWFGIADAPGIGQGTSQRDAGKAPSPNPNPSGSNDYGPGTPAGKAAKAAAEQVENLGTASPSFSCTAAEAKAAGAPAFAKLIEAHEAGLAAGYVEKALNAAACGEQLAKEAGIAIPTDWDLYNYPMSPSLADMGVTVTDDSPMPLNNAVWPPKKWPHGLAPPSSPPKPGPVKASDPSPIMVLASRFEEAVKLGELRSQKAQSLNKISTAYMHTPGVINAGARAAAYFPQDAKRSRDRRNKLSRFERAWAKGQSVFVRPCPVRPRHGFVDSRPVKSMADFETLVKETYAADPQAEIILMHEIVADWSAIATPALVTYGPGNDGATSGQGSLSIPLVSGSNAPHKMIESIFSGQTSLLGLDIHNAPYAEYVHPKDGGAAEIVQVRDGPQVQAIDHFVPDDMTVRQIVDCTGHDLMEWETLAKAMGRRVPGAGVLVIHPGGNMASHYAVHCILNKVPVVTSPLAERVKVGDVVKAQGSTPEPLTGAELSALARYISDALAPDYMLGFGVVNGEGVGRRDPLAQFAQFTVATFHAQGAWGGQDHLLRLRASGVVSLIRLMLSAGVGEMRHYQTNCLEHVKEPSPLNMRKQIVVPANKVTARFRAGGPKYGRRECYGAALFLGADDMSYALHACVRGFFKDWGQTLSSSCKRRVHVIAGPYVAGKCGYGGPKWGDCMTRAYELLQTVRGFADAPTAGGWNDLQSVWNNATQAAHNGGELLNKFVQGTGFANLPSYQGMGLVSPVVATILGLQARSEGEK